MGKIATETEARTIGGQGTAETNRMCTKARAIALGCNVASSYLDNQLVQYEHLSKAYTTVTGNWSSSLSGIPVGTVVRYDAIYNGSTGDTISCRGSGSTSAKGTFNGRLNTIYTLSSTSSTFGAIDVWPSSFTMVAGVKVTMNIGY